MIRRERGAKGLGDIKTECAPSLNHCRPIEDVDEYSDVSFTEM